MTTDAAHASQQLPVAGDATADQAIPTEIDVGASTPPPNPMRKIILITLGLLLLLFVYHVLSDRYTPYTSQARVEAYLTQIAPEVAGDVLEVGVKLCVCLCLPTMAVEGLVDDAADPTGNG